MKNVYLFFISNLLMLGFCKGEESMRFVLKEIINDPSSPIKYDSKTGEYKIVYVRTGKDRDTIFNYIIRYDPFTGEKLPASRLDFSGRVSDEDASLVFEKLKECDRMEDVIKLLGKPDIDINDKVILARHKVSRQVTYENVSKILKLVVIERTDGSLIYSVSKKDQDDNLCPSAGSMKTE